jgi:hypothetical protein
MLPHPRAKASEESPAGTAANRFGYQQHFSSENRKSKKQNRVLKRCIPESFSQDAAGAMARQFIR